MLREYVTWNNSYFEPVNTNKQLPTGTCAFLNKKYLDNKAIYLNLSLNRISSGQVTMVNSQVVINLWLDYKYCQHA